MAVVGRRNSKGRMVYRVAFYDAAGKQVWELVGTDKREAEARDRQRKREVAEGTYARGMRPTMTFGEFLQDWAAKRSNRNADDDRRLVSRFLLPREWLCKVPCEELRVRHSVQLVNELKAIVSEETGRVIGEKYVANLYGLYRTAVHAARVLELIPIDPCVLPRGMLRRGAKRGTRQPYSSSELAALTSAGGAAGTFAALALFTGMREGEVCGRRWRDIDDGAAPLACMTVASQYDDRPLKTERGEGEHARKVPIHPALASMLAAWRASGFEFHYCRKPRADDFIIPRTKDGQAHTRSSAYKLWLRACAAAKVENRSLHSSRHTFITLTRRGGARAEVIEKVTHNAAGTIVDSYTHWDWAPLCEAVMALGTALGATAPAAALPAPEPHQNLATNLAKTPFPSRKTVEALGIEPRSENVSPTPLRT